MTDNKPASPLILTQPDTSPGPFEGPEKLLEIWFAPSPADLPPKAQRLDQSQGPTQNDILADELAANSDETAGPSNAPLKYRQKQDCSNQVDNSGNDLRGLRAVPREIWEEMLDIVKCKVLSVVQGEEVDAYLLSESSLFVAPHLIILKTCGTTLNLLGLYRIIEIARKYCGLTNVWRCFYSRKSFFFPERQHGPHRDWHAEVDFLDNVFGTSGSAYTVGPVNRDHWLLYLTQPNTQPLLPSDSAVISRGDLSLNTTSSSSSTHSTISSSLTTGTLGTLSVPALCESNSAITLSPTIPEFNMSLVPPQSSQPAPYQDQTLEILMTHLQPRGREPFFVDESKYPIGSRSGHEMGAAISKELGIDALFPVHETVLDSFGFEPCGYSANAVIGSGLPDNGPSPSGSNSTGKPGGGYFTIHVTPEDGWSYASFECNVPLPTKRSDSADSRPDLISLVRRVVDIFQPNRLSVTLFVSTSSSSSSSQPSSALSSGSTGSSTTAEARAWSAIGADLLGPDFVRKDRIGYEFDGYDLIFGCFERRGWVKPTMEKKNPVGVKVAHEALAAANEAMQ